MPEERVLPLPEMHPVRSSNIHAVGHDIDRNELHIQFKDKDGNPGAHHYYPGVERNTFHEMMGADSVGSWFHQNIRSNPNLKSVKLK